MTLLGKHPGDYFHSAAEADEWLAFEEPTDEETEYLFYKENDRFHEWERWRIAWASSLSTTLQLS